MSQYTTLSTSGTDTIKLTDGTSTFRVNVRNDDLCIDVELSELGFDGKEDDDWRNLSISTISSGFGEFRLGARATTWVIDQAKTETGFDGSSPTDYENIEAHSL